MRAPNALFPSADLVSIGDGRYARLLGVLGQGSSSVVHRALLVSPTGLRRLVALKMFAPLATDDRAEVLARVGRIAARAAAVRHPNIVEVQDFGLSRNSPYFVTELVEGVSLDGLLERYASRSQRLPLDLALFIGCEVAEALHGARVARDHEGRQVGMLHLALGPRKVLLGFDGQVKVTDFETSIAAAAASSVRNLRATMHRTISVSPEVARGAPGDARSDVFSLGVLLRELLVGPRFGNVSNAEAVRLAREGYVHPAPFMPHLPTDLLLVMRRALEIEPADRYANAGSLSFDLRRVALALGVGDGRMFLKRTLDREWGIDTEVTTETSYGVTPFDGVSTLRVAGEEDLAALRLLDSNDWDILGGDGDVSGADASDAEPLSSSDFEEESPRSSRRR